MCRNRVEFDHEKSVACERGRACAVAGLLRPMVSICGRLGRVIPLLRRPRLSLQLQGPPQEHLGRPRPNVLFNNTYPWPAYFAEPLSVRCAGVEAVEKFLISCRYVRDMAPVGAGPAGAPDEAPADQLYDHWQLPEVFERIREGDCEDHAIWAWRQLHEAGYAARLVIGRFRGGAHAWVQFVRDDVCHLMETCRKSARPVNPADYQPYYSIERVGDDFAFFHHRPG